MTFADLIIKSDPKQISPFIIENFYGLFKNYTIEEMEEKFGMRANFSCNRGQIFFMYYKEPEKPTVYYQLESRINYREEPRFQLEGDPPITTNYEVVPKRNELIRKNSRTQREYDYGTSDLLINLFAYDFIDIITEIQKESPGVFMTFEEVRKIAEVKYEEEYGDTIIENMSDDIQTQMLKYINLN